MSNPEAVIGVADYILSRGFDIRGDWMWSPELADRLIIPFRYEGRIVGYTGRKITDGKPKYLSEQTPGYVFNLDAQNNDKPIVLVAEGPLDALSIGGVAILGADIMDKQAMLINRLGKRVIVIPDRDADGARTVERAIELGWSVSMPDWPEGVKDVNDAMIKLGRLATLYLIASAKESNSLKIQLKAKKWFKDNDEKNN
jgi:DNA primase